MNMIDEVLQLGPLNIYYSWLVIGGSFILGYILLTYGSPFKGDDWKDLREMVVNSVSLFIITYLFGTVFFRLPTFFADPMSVIRYPSGQRELMLASILIGVYVVVIQLRKNLNLFSYIHALMYLLLPATIIHAFFAQEKGQTVKIFMSIVPWKAHPISLYMIFFVGILLLYLLNKGKEPEQKIGLFVYFIWVGLLSMIQSFNTTVQFFEVPISQTYYLLLFFLGIFVSIFSKKFRENE